MVQSVARPLFDHLPDAFQEAQKCYKPIEDRILYEKHLGASVHKEILYCECEAEWGMYK